MPATGANSLGCWRPHPTTLWRIRRILPPHSSTAEAEWRRRSTCLASWRQSDQNPATTTNSTIPCQCSDLVTGRRSPRCWTLFYLRQPLSVGNVLTSAMRGPVSPASYHCRKRGTGVRHGIERRRNLKRGLTTPLSSAWRACLCIPTTSGFVFGVPTGNHLAHGDIGELESFTDVRNAYRHLRTHRNNPWGLRPSMPDRDCENPV